MAQVEPNFLIIGAPKAGTTSLWALLREHPDIFTPETKEIGFFCWDDVYARGFDWYCSLFAPGAGCAARGESHPRYSLIESNPESPARIAHYLPNAKLIYMVRHPLDRIVSHYLHETSLQRIPPRSFARSVRTHAPLLEGSRYHHVVQAYRRYFPDRQLKVVFFEQFTRDPETVVGDCCRFLDVDPAAATARGERRWNVSETKTIPWPIIQRMRRSSVAGGIARRLPRSLKRLIQQRAATPVEPRPRWDADTRRWAVEQLRDGIESFLQDAGKPIDYWPWQQCAESDNHTSTASGGQKTLTGRE